MTHDIAQTRLLVRTAEVSAATLDFTEQLEQFSNYPVALVVDERGGIIDCASRTVVGLSSARCAALGLYCPEDFAWKCGDYGYYLARHRFPETRHFWMIETDVRFYGTAVSEFFRFFDSHPEVDLLAADLRAAGHSWFWRRTARARNTTPYRCLFPVTRLSQRAIDALLARRISHGRYFRRRITWPNDEALVATTLLNGDFDCRDFNDFDRAFYNEKTFYYGTPINGDTYKPMQGDVQMVHPIMFGATYAARLIRHPSSNRTASWLKRQLENAAVKLNAMSRW